MKCDFLKWTESLKMRLSKYLLRPEKSRISDKKKFTTSTFCPEKVISDKIWLSKHIFSDSSISGENFELKLEKFFADSSFTNYNSFVIRYSLLFVFGDNLYFAISWNLVYRTVLLFSLSRISQFFCIFSGQ